MRVGKEDSLGFYCFLMGNCRLFLFIIKSNLTAIGKFIFPFDINELILK
jgi:hypothetical protein